MSRLETFDSEQSREYRQPAQDEISLAELFYGALVNWHWIAGSVAIAVLAAMAYLVLATDRYSTELTYSTSPGGMDVINSVPGMSLEESQALSELGTRLVSFEHFKRFLEASEQAPLLLASLREETMADDDWQGIQRSFFFEHFGFKRPPPADSAATSAVTLKYPEGFAGPEFINHYFEWAVNDYETVLVARAERAIAEAVRQNEASMQAHQAAYDEDVRSQVARLSEADDIRLAQLQDRLSAETLAVVASREERIRVLREAEHIAESLGIEKPTTPRELGRQQTTRETVYAEINSQDGLPLYFMGTQALKAEREVIEANLQANIKTKEIRDIEREIRQLEHNRTVEAMLARKNTTPFIDEYVRLSQQNILLKAHSVSTADIQVADIDHWAYWPESPDSPKPALVLALALILGTIMGLMLIAFGALWRQARAIGRTVA